MKMKFGFSGSLRSRIILMLLVFILLPISTISFFTINRFNQIVTQNAQVALENSLDYTKKNLVQFMNDIESIALMVMTNSTLLEKAVDQQTNIQIKLQNQLWVENYLKGIQMPKINAEELTVINNYGDKFSAGRNIFSPEIIEKAKWYEKLILLDGKPLWSPYGNIEGNHIFVARKIRKYNKVADSFLKTGIVLISFRQDDFKKVYSGIKLMDNASIMIVDRNGEIISHSDKKYIGAFLNEDAITQIQKEDSGTMILKILPNAAESINLYDVIPNSEWYIFITVPLSEFFKGEREVAIFLLTITGICVAVAVVAATFMAYRISKPLKRLVKETGYKISIGDFTFKHSKNREAFDEIEELKKDFEKLFCDISGAKNKIHRAEIMTKEAQLEALKSKINPHFLYNTLESVRMLALVNKDNQTAEMIKSLGDIYRYAISPGSEDVTLREELCHIKSYINLQALRYGERLKYICNVPENLMEQRILKLALQPLVENSIYHGFDMKRQSGTISINAGIDSIKAYIEIWDDGAGIGQQELDNLKAKLNLPEEMENHIGIRNVNQRIKLYFGEEYGLNIESSLGEYTRIVIRLPHL